MVSGATPSSICKILRISKPCKPSNMSSISQRLTTGYQIA
ncbi:Uncharacterised protein [Vibrio cholerae]|nr:Uncharacterised protein [Vibrio cholerae]